jgi:predicted ATPase
LSLAQKLSHPPSLVTALEGLAGLHRFRREVQAAQVRAEALIALATEQGSDYDVATGNVIRGWALVEQKQADDGLTQIRKGPSSRRPIGTGIEDNHMLGLLAEAYGNAGQVEEGLNVLDKVLAALDKTEQRFWEPELHRLKGELLMRRNEGEIETNFHYAIMIARRQRAKSLQLRALMSLSRFLLIVILKQIEIHKTAMYPWFEAPMK